MRSISTISHRVRSGSAAKIIQFSFLIRIRFENKTRGLIFPEKSGINEKCGNCQAAPASGKQSLFDFVPTKRKSIYDFSGTVFDRDRGYDEKGKICSVEIFIQNRGKMIVC